MFANFFYFIIALIIILPYLFYPSSAVGDISFHKSIVYFFSTSLLFFLFVRYRFKSLEITVSRKNQYYLDNKFNSIVKNTSILALILLAFNIYILDLPIFFRDVPFLSKTPTLQAVIFLLYFLACLMIIWAYSHISYQNIYKSNISRSEYVVSYLKFSVPVLLLWIVLSGTADIINILPFPLLKQLISTPTGQFIYFMFFLSIVVIIAPAIIQRLWQCKPLEDGEIRTRIHALCQRAGVKYSNIVYWPIFGGRMITAGVMGLVKNFRYFLVTEALLSYLNPNEIDAVISHEIAHVKKNHLLFYVFFLAVFALVLYYANPALTMLESMILLYDPIYNRISPANFHLKVFIELFFTISIFILYFRYVFGFFMRNFERQADCYVFKLFDTSVPLINTLKKIVQTSRATADRPNWHHFSIKERIEYLEKCETDRKWITHQDQKIRKGFTIFISGILLIFIILYSFSHGETSQRIQDHLNDKLFQKDCKPYIEVYENALTIEPDNAVVLNNLAWYYVTCNDPQYRDPSRALFLAQKAVKLKRESFILDTLAESYYANGQYRKALEAEEEALKLAVSDRTLYKEKIEKYRKALKNREND